MPSKICMSDIQKARALELFKAHFTAKKAASLFSFGYGTLRNLWRGFENAGIVKYNRMDLVGDKFASRQN